MKREITSLLQNTFMLCECRGCNSTNGKDYIRKKKLFKKSDWDSEPIFLCDRHSKGYELYPNITTKK